MRRHKAARENTRVSVSLSLQQQLSSVGKTDRLYPAASRSSSIDRASTFGIVFGNNWPIQSSPASARACDALLRTQAHRRAYVQPLAVFRGAALSRSRRPGSLHTVAHPLAQPVKSSASHLDEFWLTMPPLSLKSAHALKWGVALCTSTAAASV